MSLPVALQLYSVRNEMEKDFAGTVRRVAEMGYSGVEFAGLFGLSAAEVKKICADAGLVPVCAHVPLDELLADTQGTIANYRAIGCAYIAVPYLPEERRPGTPGFAETLVQIQAIGEACKKQGLVLLYHNHDFEFVKIDGKYALDYLYDSIPADCLQTELDTCWVNVGGEDPAAYIAKYTGRAPIVHLKDFILRGHGKPEKLYALIGIDDDGEQASEDAFSFKPVGCGVQDMPAIVAAAEKAGAHWLVVEQDQPDRGNTELGAAQMSREYLRTNGLA